MNDRLSSRVSTLPEVFYQELAIADVVFTVAAIAPESEPHIAREPLRLLRSVLSDHDIVVLKNEQDVSIATAGLVRLERSRTQRAASDPGGVPLIVTHMPEDHIASAFLAESRVAARQSPVAVHDLAELLHVSLQSGFTYFANHGVDALLVAKASASWIVIQCVRGFGEGLRSKSRELVDVLLDRPVDGLRHGLHTERPRKRSKSARRDDNSEAP